MTLWESSVRDHPRNPLCSHCAGVGLQRSPSWPSPTHDIRATRRPASRPDDPCVHELLCHAGSPAKPALARVACSPMTSIACSTAVSLWPACTKKSRRADDGGVRGTLKFQNMPPGHPFASARKRDEQRTTGALRVASVLHGADVTPRNPLLSHVLHGAYGIGSEASKSASERSTYFVEMPVFIGFLASQILAIPA